MSLIPENENQFDKLRREQKEKADVEAEKSQGASLEECLGMVRPKTKEGEKSIEEILGMRHS